MDTALLVGIISAAALLLTTLLTLYHKPIETFIRKLLKRKPPVADGGVKGIGGITTPPGVMRIDAEHFGQKVLTFDETLSQIRSIVVQQLEDHGWVPDLVIGSARGGAICAGIIAANMNRDGKRLPVRVVDCLHEGASLFPDLAALREEDLAGAQRILIVESTRKTGAVYSQIVERVKMLNPSAQIKDFALVWAPSDLHHELQPPGMYAVLSDGLNPARLKLPWYF